MNLAHTHRCPSYTNQILSSVSNNPFRQRLRSSDGTDYNIPPTNTKSAERAFSRSGPSHWNSLPESYRAPTDPRSFKKNLKTYYFNFVTFNQILFRLFFS